MKLQRMHRAHKLSREEELAFGGEREPIDAETKEPLAGMALVSWRHHRLRRWRDEQLEQNDQKHETLIVSLIEAKRQVALFEAEIEKCKVRRAVLQEAQRA